MGNSNPCCCNPGSDNDILKNSPHKSSTVDVSCPQNFTAASQIMLKNFENIIDARLSSIDIAQSNDSCTALIETERQMTQEVKYLRLHQKYKKIIMEARLYENIEDRIQKLTTPIQDAVVLNKGVHDKENGLTYEISVKEVVSNNVRYHEYLHNYEMKNMTPDQFTFIHLLMSLKDINRYDDKMASHQILFCYQENEVFYYVFRLTIKKNIFFAGKEIICASAYKKLDDGRYIDIFKSINDPDYPINNSG